MKRKKRKILTAILFILFLIVAPSIFFYSQGYRIDKEQRKIVQTGAFYFKVSPKRTDVYIDGKLVKKTDWLFDAALIENILPKNHIVQIKKPGFHSWEKELGVVAKKVTDAKFITLFPEDINFEIASIDIESLFPSPDQKRLILKQSSQVNKMWVLETFDCAKKTRDPLLESIDLSLKDIQFVNLKWSPGSDKILIETIIEKETKYFLVRLNNQGSKIEQLSFLPKDIEEINFNPEDEEILFFTKESHNLNNQDSSIKTYSLYEVNLVKKTILPPVLERLLVVNINHENISYLSSDGFIFKANFSGDEQERINPQPFLLKENAHYRIIVNHSEILLKENETIFFFDQEEEIFKQALDQKDHIVLSPGTEKAAAWNNYEISLLFLKDQESPSKRITGESVFLIRFSKKIDEVLWLNDHYLIFNTGDKIKITEIDVRDHINTIDLGEFEDPEIYFNGNEKNLYILSKNRLFISKPIL